MDPNTRTIEQLANEIIEGLDKSYDLVYMDYRDQLTDEQAGMIVRGDMEKFWDSTFEWESDQKWDACKTIITDAAKEVVANWEREDDPEHDGFYEFLLGEFEGTDAYDSVRYAIEERDNGKWVEELCSHYGRVLLRIEAIDEDHGYSFEEVTAERVISDLNRTNQRGGHGFNPDAETIETINYVLANSSPEFSVLMGYWVVGADVSDIYKLTNEPDAEIDIVNPYLYLGNPFAGSGFISERPLSGTILVKREDLRTDKDAFGYSLDNVYGGLNPSDFECEIRPVKVTVRMTDLWHDDSIQFPRLLAEINATQEIDIQALCEAMDLDVDEIHELFDRADVAWERIKKEL